MGRWPKDTQAARNAFYGDPSKGQIASQMVPVVPPFAMYYEGKRVKAIQFHRKAAPSLLAALNEIWDYYEHDQKKVDAAEISKYAGAYNPRKVRGSKTKWSNHAYAAAIDLDAEDNGLYSKGDMPQAVIDAFCRQGWMWGGWYKGRKDPMHFEAVDNGGRVPSSPRPVWPRPAAAPAPVQLVAAPADELEDVDPAPDAAPSALTATVDAPAPAIVNEELSAKSNRPVLVSTLPVDEQVREVQKQLRLKGFYSVGEADGKLGEDTKDAIMAFRRRNGLPISTDIDDELLAALATADKKPVSEARVMTTAADLAQKNVGVRAAIMNRLAAFWATIVAAGTAIFTAIASAFQTVWDSEAFQSVRLTLGDVPIWAWLGLAALCAGFIYWNSRRGINADVQAHHEGRSL